MRDLIIDKLIESKTQHAKRVWHWGKEKIIVLEVSLRVQYNRLSDEDILEKYDEMIADYYI